MSEEIVIKNCSPTLAGMKTANLFTCPYENYSKLKKDILLLNQKLVDKGLRVIPLLIRKNNALIYVYRPAFLTRDLLNSQALDILLNYGYDCPNAEHCLIHLISRLKENDTFPHEIGLFLGYPPCDVKGFINNDTEKFTGFWKVYDNEEEMKTLFTKFKKCTQSFIRQFSYGKTIERLVIQT